MGILFLSLMEEHMLFGLLSLGVCIILLFDVV